MSKLALTTLISKFREGDRDAWSEICERVIPGLRWHTQKLLWERKVPSSILEADDLVDDALIKVWEKHETMETQKTGPFVNYLIKTIRNRITNELTRKCNQVPHTEVDSGYAAPDETPSALASWEEQSLRLQTLIAELPEPDHTICVAYFYRNMSLKEIAELVGIDRTNVSRRISKVKMMVLSQSEE